MKAKEILYVVQIVRTTDSLELINEKARKLERTRNLNLLSTIIPANARGSPIDVLSNLTCDGQDVETPSKKLGNDFKRN